MQVFFLCCFMCMLTATCQYISKFVIGVLTASNKRKSTERTGDPDEKKGSSDGEQRTQPKATPDWLGCFSDIPVAPLVSLTLQDLSHFHSCLDWFSKETGYLLYFLKIKKLELEIDYLNLKGKTISLAVLSLCLGN